MGPGFWLVTAPASWAAGSCGSVLTASMGAPFLAAAGIGFSVCVIAAAFIQGLIDDFVGSNTRNT
jgi:hypothetical protein